jgi:hypothetical protein
MVEGDGWRKSLTSYLPSPALFLRKRHFSEKNRFSGFTHEMRNEVTASRQAEKLPMALSISRKREAERKSGRDRDSPVCNFFSLRVGGGLERTQRRRARKLTGLPSIDARESCPSR